MKKATFVLLLGLVSSSAFADSGTCSKADLEFLSQMNDDLPAFSTVDFATVILDTLNTTDTNSLTSDAHIKVHRAFLAAEKARFSSILQTILTKFPNKPLNSEEDLVEFISFAKLLAMETAMSEISSLLPVEQDDKLSQEEIDFWLTKIIEDRQKEYHDLLFNDPTTKAKLFLYLNKARRFRQCSTSILTETLSPSRKLGENRAVHSIAAMISDQLKKKVGSSVATLTTDSPPNHEQASTLAN